MEKKEAEKQVEKTTEKVVAEAKKETKPRGPRRSKKKILLDKALKWIEPLKDEAIKTALTEEIVVVCNKIESALAAQKPQRKSKGVTLDACTSIEELERAEAKMLEAAKAKVAEKIEAKRKQLLEKSNQSNQPN